MEFNLAEKLALVKAVDEVIYVDGKVDPEEIDFMTQLMDTLKFDKNLIEEARKITPPECKYDTPYHYYSSLLFSLLERNHL